MRRLLLPLGALLLGVGAGATFRWMAGPAGESVESARDVQAPPARTSPQPPSKPGPAYRSAEAAWIDRTGPRFGDFAAWILQAGEREVVRTWELRCAEEGALGRILDPATALLLVRWAQLDPGAMIEAAGRNPYGYAMWARVDAEAAVVSAREWIATPPSLPGEPVISPKPWAEESRSTFLLELSQFDPARALDLLQHDPAFQGAQEWIVTLINQRVHPESFDPEAVTQSNGMTRPGITAWAAADPDAALQWLAGRIRSGNGLEWNEQRDLLAAFAPEDPEELGRMAAILPAGEIQSRFLSVQISQFALRDPEAALAFARSQTGVFNRHELLTAIGGVLAKENPLRSVDLLAEVLAEDPIGADASLPLTYPDGSTKVEAVPVASQWLIPLAISAPEETMDLLDDLPDTFAKRGPAWTLSMEWLRSNQVGYSEWVQGLPAGPKRDAFVGFLVSELAELESDGRGYFPAHPQSLRWASRIEDAELRNKFLHRAITRWKLFSPGEAAGFLESPAAPEEARTIHAAQAGKETR